MMEGVEVARRHAAWGELSALVAAIAIAAVGTPIEAQSAVSHMLGGNVVPAKIVVKSDLLPDHRLPLGWRSLFAATLNDRDEAAVAMHARPGTLITLYESDGSARWSVAVPTARVESIAFAGDTIAYLERFEDQPSLVLLAGETGTEFERIAIRLSGFEQARILGKFNDEWHVQVSELAGEYKAARFPYRTVRRFDRTTRRWRDVATREDSSPRAIALNGADALPPPFSPAPRYALSERHGLYFAAGDSWDIEAVDTAGKHTTHLRLQPIDREFSDSEWQRAVADWQENPPMIMSGYSSALYAEAALKGRRAAGRTISTLFASADGDLLVRRRDADSLSSATLIPSVWDVIRPASDTIVRLSLAPNETVVAFASHRRVLVRTLSAQGKGKLRILELQPEGSNARSTPMR